MAMAANVCDNCEGTEFELLDGHYFCKICSVQSQQLIEVEAGFSQVSCSLFSFSPQLNLLCPSLMGCVMARGALWPEARYGPRRVMARGAL